MIAERLAYSFGAIANMEKHLFRISESKAAGTSQVQVDITLSYRRIVHSCAFCLVPGVFICFLREINLG